MLEKKLPKGKKGIARPLWQAYQHNEKILQWVTENRVTFRDSDFLETIKALDEMIALAHGNRLRFIRIAKELFDCDPVSLEAYK